MSENLVNFVIQLIREKYDTIGGTHYEKQVKNSRILFLSTNFYEVLCPHYQMQYSDGGNIKKA
jgi:hypothetical protein